MTEAEHPRSLEELELPFRIREGELMVNGIPLSRLAARVGRTPFFAYDRSAIDARVATIREAFPEEAGLSYAMKANPMPALVQHMARTVDGIDVASAGELMVALDTGIDPSRVSLAGPGKRREELQRAVAAGILVNVESERELPILAAASQALGLPGRIAIRVNPPYTLKGSGVRMGGGGQPFGIDAERVPEVLGRLREMDLTFEGFHFFAGSQTLDAGAISEALRLGFALASRLAGSAPSAVRTLNLGGGFGIPYFPGDAPLVLDPIAETLHDLVARASVALPHARLHLELGRYLVGSAGIYVCKVLDRKESRDATFLVTDGGLHHHLAASGNFGQVLRKNYPVILGTRAADPGTQPVHVVGPLCTPLDRLADRASLPPASVDDLVVVFQSGAYGASASPNRFLDHPPPMEVLV